MLKEGNLEEQNNSGNDRFRNPVIQFLGGGGLVSTLHDYSRFCRMMIYEGDLDGMRVLQKSTVHLIMSNQLPEGVKYENGGGYGLGGSFNLENGTYSWGSAASTTFSIDPKNNMIGLAFTQLMPYNFGFADDFKKIVIRAVMK